MEIARIVGTFKVLPVYQCAHCGDGAVGDSLTLTIDDLSADVVPEVVKNMRPPAHAMPVGWGNYADGFRCPTCKDCARR